MRFTCAGGPWRSVELRHLAERMMADPVAVSHDPAVAETADQGFSERQLARQKDRPGSRR